MDIEFSLDNDDDDSMNVHDQRRRRRPEQPISDQTDVSQVCDTEVTKQTIVKVRRLPFYSVGADVSVYKDISQSLLTPQQLSYGLYETVEKSQYQIYVHNVHEHCWNCDGPFRLPSHLTSPMFLSIKEYKQWQEETADGATTLTTTYWDVMGCFCCARCARGFLDRNPVWFSNIHPDSLSRLAVQLGHLQFVPPVLFGAPPPHRLTDSYGGIFTVARFRFLFCDVVTDNDDDDENNETNTNHHKQQPIVLLPPEPPLVRHLSEWHVELGLTNNYNVEKSKTFEHWLQTNTNHSNGNNGGSCGGAQVFRFRDVVQGDTPKITNASFNRHNTFSFPAACAIVLKTPEETFTYGTIQSQSQTQSHSNTSASTNTTIQQEQEKEKEHSRKPRRCWHCRRRDFVTVGLNQGQQKKQILYGCLDTARNNMYRCVGDFCSEECIAGFFQCHASAGICQIDGFDPQLHCEFCFLLGISNGMPLAASPLPFDQKIAYGGTLTDEEYDDLYIHTIKGNAWNQPEEEKNNDDSGHSEYNKPLQTEQVHVCDVGMAYVVGNPDHAVRLAQAIHDALTM
jgi:hypothetical protein